jgi:hypothetical protein
VVRVRVRSECSITFSRTRHEHSPHLSVFLYSLQREVLHPQILQLAPVHRNCQTRPKRLQRRSVWVAALRCESAWGKRKLEARGLKEALRHEEDTMIKIVNPNPTKS